MSTAVLTGSCLCGEVAFEAYAMPSLFQYCSCESCRKMTGSAHAANLFVPKEAFAWMRGEALLRSFKETKHNPGFLTCFCTSCGSVMPHPGRTGRDMAIPAGVLDKAPAAKPRAIIYCSEIPEWYVPTTELPQYPGLPD